MTDIETISRLGKLVNLAGRIIVYEQWRKTSGRFRPSNDLVTWVVALMLARARAHAHTLAHTPRVSSSNVRSCLLERYKFKLQARCKYL